MSPGWTLAITALLGVATVLNIAMVFLRWRRTRTLAWFQVLIVAMLLITLGFRIPLFRLSVRLAEQKEQLATLDATLEIIKKAQADHTGRVSYMIHTPQQGCPAGWGLAVGIFTEKDGSHEDGCVHGQGPTGEVDVLKPEESVRVEAFVPVPQTAEPSGDLTT